MNVLSRTLKIVATLTLLSIPLLAQSGVGPAVYSMSNATPNNELVVFPRSTSGVLSSPTSYSTGGAGTGAGLGSDNAVQIGPEGRWLVTVNAGSNTVALFDLTKSTPKLVSVANSGGLTPNSIALVRDRFYVLNSGSPANVAGFDVTPTGLLRPIPGSVQFLSTAAPQAPQIGFSDGYVFVTEKATNSIDVFTVGTDGSLSPATVYPSAGATPFGFLFDHRGHLMVTEAQGAAAGASTVSSYAVSNTGTLQVISSSVPNYQTASCWIAISNNKQYIYVANTDSDDLSEYQLASNGSLTVVGNGIAATVAAGSKPADLAFSGDGRFLYVSNGGLGTITGWAVAADGALTPVGTFGSLPTSVAGLAAQ